MKKILFFCFIVFFIKIEAQTNFGGKGGLTIKANNNIGIGNTNPTNKLSINGNLQMTTTGTGSGTNSVTINNSASTRLFTILDNGNVGIGLSNPSVALQINGDLKYNFIHAVASADSIAWVSGSSQNVYYKINTGSFVSHEADGITIAGDSMQVPSGDYLVFIDLGTTTSNANDRIRCKIYQNNIASPTSLGRFIINSSGSTTTIQPQCFFWYLVNVANNTWLSWRISNTTGARAMTVRDFKIYVEKKPE